MQKCNPSRQVAARLIARGIPVSLVAIRQSTFWYDMSMLLQLYVTL
jgi:hypothetical protein